MVRVGCSGWSYEDWRGILYPSSGSSERWLELYAGGLRHGRVERDVLPAARTAPRWRGEHGGDAAQGFCFAVKVTRYLTHVRRLQTLRPGMAKLLDQLEPLGAAGKLGPTCGSWRQHCAATMSCSATPSRCCRRAVRPSSSGTRAGSRRRCTRCCATTAQRSSWPTARQGARRPRRDIAGWTFIRLHRGRARDGAYGRRALETWADRIRNADGDVYAYFNNDWQGLAVQRNRALTLRPAPCSVFPQESVWRRRYRGDERWCRPSSRRAGTPEGLMSTLTTRKRELGGGAQGCHGLRPPRLLLS